jgi:hypothetical protein
VTLREQIVDFINGNRGQRYTNSEIARYLQAPEPSVRRATLKAMNAGQIGDAGPSHYNPAVVTYSALDLS